jgi:signal transduction histidine kinase
MARILITTDFLNCLTHFRAFYCIIKCALPCAETSVSARRESQGEMSRRSELRLTVFEVALFLVVLSIGWATVRAFRIARQVDQIPITFRTMPDAYFRIADYLEPSVIQLNEILQRYTARHDRADWERFQRKSQELKDWLTDEKASSMRTKITMLQPVQITTDIGALLDEINSAYDMYLVEAHRAVGEPSIIEGTSPNTTTQDRVRLQSRKLIGLASQARAQGQAIQIFLSGSKSWFPWLQRVLLAALLLLVAFGVWLTVVAYRRVVFPLRRRLLESDTIIERNQKMAHFGELAAGIAHEIRNPLTAIRARLFTLQKTIVVGTPAHEDALVIRNEIDRLNRIVTDFLQLARPAEPRLAPVTAEPLLREVRDLFAPQCERQSIELKIDPVNGARFIADSQQMKQVLINLIQNAADSIEVEGTITLRAREEERRLDEGVSDVVVLEVQDTGGGIPPDVQNRLFDPFFSTKKGGTGLGLSIAAQIVNNHHGKLEFHTQLGQGTTFAIVLPAERKHS